MQRSIFLNGLPPGIGGEELRGEPADVSRLLVQGVGYYGATVALFVLYVWVLVLCRRGLLVSRSSRYLALLFPVLFYLGLLLGRPYLSIDLFSYLAHGYLGAQPGTNPYVQFAADVADTPFGAQLMAAGWQPVHPMSPYGPLWTMLETAVVGLAQHVPTGVFLIQASVVVASLGSAALIWAILGRVRPEEQLFGTLLYLWNPAVVVEFAAEGHNDAPMVLGVLAALALAVRTRPAASVVALLLGALTKYLPLIFLPTLLAYFWRTRGNPLRLVLSILAGLVIASGLAALLYSPFWAGSSTFDGVRLSGQPFPSPAGLLSWYLLRDRPLEDAVRLAMRILGVAFVVFLLFVSWRVRDARSLLGACATVALGYLLVFSPGYWPWYITLPLALMALSPRGIYLWMTLILTLCSRLIAPLADLAVNGFVPWPTALWLIPAVGVTLPLVLLLLLLLGNAMPQRQRRSQGPAAEARGQTSL